MLSLVEYIKESMNNDNLIPKLSSNRNLKGYVNYLNEMLKHDDARAIIKKAFIDCDDKDAYKFDVKIKNIDLNKLHPTQNEIDIDSSIGFPFKADDVKLRDNCVKMFYKSNGIIKMPFPLITFNGKYIIDGHHRWSQAYSFVPDGKMECFDLLIYSNDKINIDEQDMLKIVQGLIAAKCVENGKTEMPMSIVKKGRNLFDYDMNAVLLVVNEYCNKYTEAATNLLNGAIKAGYLNNNDELNDYANFITNNLMDLKKENMKYANKGNSRECMPQTDAVDKGASVDKTLLKKIEDDEFSVDRDVIK